MKKTAIIISLVAIVFGWACEKIIEIDLGATEPRLVINSVITPDSVVSITLSRSMHILDNHNIMRITNATVKLYENDVEVAQLVHSANGKYAANFHPVLGRTYTIKVSAEGFDDVSASCTLDPPVAIVDIDTSVIKDEYQQSMLALDVKFTDPGNRQNYYMLQAYLKYSYEMYDPYGFTVDTLYQNEDTVIVDTTWGIYTMQEMMEPMYLTSNDVIVESISSFGNGLVFRDELISGTTYTMKSSAYVYAYSAIGDMYAIVYMRSISKDYYMYMKTLSAHYSANGDPFAEPVFVYSNVENGMGIFAGYTQTVDSIKLDPSQFNGGWYWESNSAPQKNKPIR